jgi:hypothetical protein
MQLTITLLSQGMTLTCVECTFAGDLSVESAEFSVDTIQEAADTISDFWDNGYIQFTAHKFDALMDFELQLPAAFTLEFDAYLPSIPLGAITVCLFRLLLMHLLTRAVRRLQASSTSGQYLSLPSQSA